MRSFGARVLAAASVPNDSFSFGNLTWRLPGAQQAEQPPQPDFVVAILFFL